MERGKHEAQIIFEIDRVMELYYRKYTVKEISTVTGISQTDIKDVIESVKQAWRDKTLFNFEQQKMEEVETVNLVQRLAFRAFEGSKKHKLNRTTVKRTKDVFGPKLGAEIHAVFNELGKKNITDVSKKPDEEGQIEEVTTVNEVTPGDKAYLDVILNCVDKRAKLLGTYAPVKTVSKVDTSVNNNLSITLEHMTPEERLEYKKEMIKALIESGTVDIKQLMLPESPEQEVVYKLPENLRKVIDG